MKTATIAMIRIRRNKGLVIKIALLALFVFLCANWYSDNVLAGEIHRFINYESYKRTYRGQRMAWFEELAQEDGLSLHAASGWGYLTEHQYNSNSI